MEGLRLLRKGLHQSEVARRVRVSHRSVGRWAKAYAEQGRRSLRKAGRAGRKPRLSGEDWKRLERGLLRGPEALGYETPLWTSGRVADLIQREFSVRYTGHRVPGTLAAASAGAVAGDLGPAARAPQPGGSRVDPGACRRLPG